MDLLYSRGRGIARKTFVPRRAGQGPLGKGAPPGGRWGLYFAAGEMYEVNKGFNPPRLLRTFGFAERQSSVSFADSSFAKGAFWEET